MSTSWHSGFQLQIIEGPEVGRVIHLRAPLIIVGRARADDDQDSPGWVLLRDASVSRQHGNLRWDEDARCYVFLHRSGTNLSWLNEEPVQEAPLKPGDVLRIGPVHLKVEEANPAEAPAPKAAAPVPAQAEAPPPRAAPKTLALRVGYGFHLEIEAGPGQGQTRELTGLFITVGHNSTQPPPTEAEPNPRPFDQLVELGDPAARPNHLVLRWRESDKAYSLFRHPDAPPVKVRRNQDGLDFEAWLLDQGAVLRQGDQLDLGGTRLRLVYREERGERKVNLESGTPRP